MDAAGALIAATLVIAIFVLARWHTLRASTRSRPRRAFCAGPDNLGLYDHPYFYPTYAGRMATAWDASRRCAAYCGIGDCAVWCR